MEDRYRGKLNYNRRLSLLEIWKPIALNGVKIENLGLLLIMMAKQIENLLIQEQV